MTSKPRLPTDAAERKKMPLSALFDYFDLALAEVATVIYGGNKQHNPDSPTMVWDRSKSTDQADCLLRHFVERGTVDTDGLRHSAKLAWRALAMLQLEVEAATGAEPSRASINTGYDDNVLERAFGMWADESPEHGDDLGFDANGSPVGQLQPVPAVPAPNKQPEQLSFDFSSTEDRKTSLAGDAGKSAPSMPPTEAQAVGERALSALGGRIRS